jgi:cell division protein FtsL
MSRNLPARIYTLFRTSPTASPQRRNRWISIILVAVVVLIMAVVRVDRRQEVLAVGYRLSRAAEQLRDAQETTRRLELERSTLTSPARIRALATQLGMVPVPAESIRLIPARQTVASSTTDSSEEMP